MKAQQYAKAIFQVSHNKSDLELNDVVLNTITLLKKNGHIKLLSSIVRELEKIIKRRQTTDEAVISVANKDDIEKYSEILNSDIKKLNAENLPKKIIKDDTLIGGYQIYANGIQIDRTYKRTLLSMYTELIIN